MKGIGVYQLESLPAQSRVGQFSREELQSLCDNSSLHLDVVESCNCSVAHTDRVLPASRRSWESSIVQHFLDTARAGIA